LDRIERVINLLSYLASSGKACGVTEISKRLKIDKSSVSRILSTLEKLNWVVQFPDSTYGLSVKPLEFGLSIISGIDIKKVSQPHLVELNNITQETTGLNVPIGLEYILLDQVECKLPLRHVLQLGTRTPLWFGAPGKAMLAFMDESEINEIIDKIKSSSEKIPVSGEILEIGKLLGEIDEVRKQGFTISTGELTSACVAVASPVFDHRNKVIGSIIVTGPIPRFNKKIARDFGPLVKQTAKDISIKLGSSYNL
jgi:IclR family acetate operon transcriptional repressor